MTITRLRNLRQAIALRLSRTTDLTDRNVDAALPDLGLCCARWCSGVHEYPHSDRRMLMRLRNTPPTIALRLNVRTKLTAHNVATCILIAIYDSLFN